MNYPNARHNAWAAAPLKRTRACYHNRILSSLLRLIEKRASAKTHTRERGLGKHGDGKPLCLSRAVQFLVCTIWQDFPRYHHSPRAVANSGHNSPRVAEHSKFYIYKNLHAYFYFKIFFYFIFHYFNSEFFVWKYLVTRQPGNVKYNFGSCPPLFSFRKPIASLARNLCVRARLFLYFYFLLEILVSRIKIRKKLYRRSFCRPKAMIDIRMRVRKRRSFITFLVFFHHARRERNPHYPPFELLRVHSKDVSERSMRPIPRECGS